MKKIATKSYVSAQTQTVKVNPNLMRNPNSPNQSNPKIAKFQQDFAVLALPGITNISEPDAMILNNIQEEIRKKLRMAGMTPGV
jgi:hypothetical protein